jgi:RNA recognition motif-containing protein
MKLYVGNLSFETTENDLQDLFEQHGTVNEVQLMLDKMTSKSRGFAFVTMNDGAQASAAMSALNGRELNGRTLTVNEARPREERSRPHGTEPDRCPSSGGRAHGSLQLALRAQPRRRIPRADREHRHES